MAGPSQIERELLSVCLSYGEAADEVDLEPEDFEDWRHQEIWRAIRKCRADGVGVTPAMLEDRCARWGAVGGYTYLSTVLSASGLRDMTRTYGARLHEAALTRRLKGALIDLGGSDLDGDALLEESMRRLSGLASRKTESGRLIEDCARAYLGELQTRMDARARGERSSAGVATGLTDLDDLTGGLRRGVVTILGGRPSTGKSSLSRQIAEAAAGAGMGVHYFSCEDSWDALTARSLGAAARVPVYRLMGLDLNSRDYAELVSAANATAGRKWWIDDAAGLSSEQIGLRVRRRKRELVTGLVVVDYVQLLRERGARDLRANVEQAAEGLVRLAREEGVALLLLSQLSRAAVQDGGKDSRPQLYHLRETGALEQVADMVWMLYRDEERAPTVLEVLVRKNKHGPLGKVSLHWDAERASAADLASGDVPAPARSGHWTDEHAA